MISSLLQDSIKSNRNFKFRVQAAYEYIGEKGGQAKGIARDENGRVKTEPPQIYSNPTTKVEKNFLKFPKYIEDPYNRKTILEK